MQEENQTNIQLIETQFKHKLMSIKKKNLLDSERQNAKNLLSNFKSNINQNEFAGDSIVRKLNFSVCLNNSQNDLKFPQFHNQTTPCSPIRANLANEEHKVDSRLNSLSKQNKFQSNIKSRSRNPSSSDLKFVTSSMSVAGTNPTNKFHTHQNSTGVLNTFRHPSFKQNIHMSINNNKKSSDEVKKTQLNWFEENIESNQNDQIFTVNSSMNKVDTNNPYKRTLKSKSKSGNISNSDKALHHISEIHQHSKENSEDINGTLMNSIVNLFPNKFKSKSSSSNIAKLNNPNSDFTVSVKNSLSKEDLQEKLEKIQRNRQNSGDFIREFHESND